MTLNENRPGLKPRCARLGHHREQLADEREQAGVGRRVRSRRAADRRLIDLDHLVDQVDAFDLVVRARLVGGAVELARQRLVQDVVDQRALAGSADAGDGDQPAERDLHVDVLQVVGAGALDDDLALGFLAARLRRRDRALPAEIRAGQRAVTVADQLRRRSLEDQLSAQLAGAGAEVDHVIGGANRLLVVLDHHHGVAEIAQPAERGQQLAIVALVQADRRLVEHVQHAGQVRADLRGEANALAFAARQRGRRSRQREIADADVVEEPQPIADLLQDARRDDRFAIVQLEAVEERQRFGDRQVDVVGDRSCP